MDDADFDALDDLRAGGGGAPISPGATAVESLLSGLNPAQAKAVEHGEGPLLVLAGAGSGKTRVLTHRVAYLLATGMARPSEILAITFTNKAAGEMKERVGALTGAAARVMWVMTFHSACARILRQHADRLAYKRGFTIYDEADSRRMVKRCMDELEIDPKRFPPRSIKGQISGAKNRLRDAETLREEQGSFFEATVADVYELYEKRMHTANAMDFDDLLVRTVNLFELFTDLRERYARNFRHVLVDEYQDTNRVQYRLLQLLTGEHGNLFVVGDESQSVYGFRAADIRNILDFERDFPEAATVKLEQNYRSTGTILDAANGLISHNRDRLDKNLWTDAGRGRPGDDLRASRRARGGSLDRRRDRSSRRRGGDRPRRRRDLLPDQRAEPGAGGHARPLRCSLPGDRRDEVLRTGRDPRRDRLPSVLANPDDTVSLTRIINSPRRGIGNTSEGRVLGWANTTGVSPLEAVGQAETIPGLGAAARKAIGRFAELIASLTERAERRGPVAELLESVLSESGYIEALEAERTVEAEGRIENLQELVGMAAEFDANRELEGESEMSPLEEFLEQISLINEQDALTDDATKVTLDDAPQRQGPRVQGRVHDRLRGRRLPAFALDRRGQPRGGAPPLLRRPDPGARVPDAHLRPPPQPLRRQRRRDPVAIPLGDPRPSRRAPHVAGDGHRLGDRTKPRRRAVGGTPATTAPTVPAR